MPELPSEARTYNRYCALSRALDVIGERWSLLIVLELLSGPKRFTDLEQGVAGIARNLLSKRLKHLQACEVIQKRDLEPPAHSTVYELTDTGRALEPAIRELQRWGVEFLGFPDEDQELRGEWILEALISLADESEIGDFSATYAFQLDDSMFHLRIADGSVEGREAPFQNIDLTVRGTAHAFAEAMVSQQPVDRLADDGGLEFEGDPSLFDRLRALYPFHQSE